jgi:hypothetical protein
MATREENRQAKKEEVLDFLRKIHNGVISKAEHEKMQEEWAFEKQTNLFKSRAKALVTLAIKGYVDDSETAELIGCSHLHYMVHLSRQFHKGMSFDNKNEWEVDHIIPISSAKTKEEILVLSKFTNLQPLWRKNNRQKHSKRLYLI